MKSTIRSLSSSSTFRNAFNNTTFHMTRFARPSQHSLTKSYSSTLLVASSRPDSNVLDSNGEDTFEITAESVKAFRQVIHGKKPIRSLDEHGRAYAVGRRKTAVATVWLSEGSGQVTINNRPFIEYFQSTQRKEVLLPFEETQTAGMYDLKCTVRGGGISGQAGAVRLGVARALEIFDHSRRPALRKAGYLTRDSRRVERKKPGQKKARKQFQWVKR